MHLPDRDLEFKRKGKLYVADMSDWITTPAHVNATVAERERLYTKKEVTRARRAQEFIRASGYASEKEAVYLVSDGNITGVPLTAKDIRRAFDIYWRSAAAVRGKTTRKKTSREEVDDALKEQRTDQVIYTDVMKVREQPYLVSLVEPLHIGSQPRDVRTSRDGCAEAAQSAAIERIQPGETARGAAISTSSIDGSVPRGGDRYRRSWRSPR